MPYKNISRLRVLNDQDWRIIDGYACLPDDKGCREWTGDYESNKIPVYKGHRIRQRLYEREHGQSPHGVRTTVTCKNYRCVSVDHVKIGRGQPYIPNMPPVRNDDNGNAVLSNEQVGEIREALNRGQSQVSLGKTFGVHKSTISKIKNDINWKYLP